MGRLRSDSVSVVISTRNRGARIVPTLQSVFAGAMLPLEIIVVDQSDEAIARATWCAVEQVADTYAWRMSYEDESILLDQPGDLCYIRSRKHGLSHGRNSGAHAARGDILIFADDDIIADAHWVEMAHREFESDPQVVGMYGKVLPYVIAREPNRELDAEFEAELGGAARDVFIEPAVPWYLGSGGNIAFRRDVLNQCGLFDPLLGAGARLQACEGLDLGYRLLSFHLGKIIYIADWLVQHNHPKDFGEQIRAEQAFGIGAGGMLQKFARCGDPAALKYLRLWIWRKTIRRFRDRISKWRRRERMQLALVQFWYPLVGAMWARRCAIDRAYWTFRDEP